MTINAAALRELHRLHEQLADLRSRLERGPKRIAGNKANVAKLAQELVAAEEIIKQTRLMSDRKQLDLKSSEEKIENWKAKLNTCSSNKEYQTLQEQIAAAEMANSVLADEILEALERVDDLVAKGAEVRQRGEAGKAELAKVTADVAATTATLEAEIARLEGDLSAAEAKLPSEFKQEYERCIRLKGADGMAAMEDSVCTGCGQTITLNMQNELVMSRPVFCKSCGCLLYLPEP